MESIDLKICKLADKATLPVRATEKSACFDVTACFRADSVKAANRQKKIDVLDFTSEGGVKPYVRLFPQDRVLIPTGLIILIPDGYEIAVRPRSGIAFKRGIVVANAPGTIDCDYTHETFILMMNAGDVPVTIQDGERIAQIAVQPITADRVTMDGITMDDVLAFRKEQERQGGFGHTGT